MSAIPASRTLLGHILLADGLISGATGALMFFAAGPLSDLLGLHVTLLRSAGFSLLPFAALLVFLAMRPLVPRALVWAIIVANVLWTVDSFVLLASGWVQPTVWGQAFTLVQALAVAGFTCLELMAVKQARVVHA
ncbi:MULTISPECIES: hypothetical protein [Myxococcus]|uniref:Uncharacterized protein n=1 Tax=Myxococcus llanfairpwllgwyngyllgogerychwyrndrobwllllantysiliogogogochensis TaxID=2590453 RepID=A0A540X8Z9_9BACT|nr:MULTISPECIES: hypothetical protein [Myxococcus]NTX03263.1 hypothetical protein [Myxococcus sp. CA040A]NTX34226.1 hypothetical protein [Myxococcus sp. CA033]NTX53147.1 hypothetical protein [Myxococcus sp. CA039A]TQF17781.1 hypothetical protein FJV41_01125 [Myxococcus llanfairpwllgwyngyllgogerychwyrndrobwllllantysiliogogogochensis]